MKLFCKNEVYPVEVRVGDVVNLVCEDKQSKQILATFLVLDKIDDQHKVFVCFSEQPHTPAHSVLYFRFRQGKIGYTADYFYEIQFRLEEGVSPSLGQ